VLTESVVKEVRGQFLHFNEEVKYKYQNCLNVYLFPSFYSFL